MVATMMKQSKKQPPEARISMMISPCVRLETVIRSALIIISIPTLTSEEIYVARAPGRLDVVGGIADYSGSLVLQMPIREACHVVVQQIQPDKQRLWKHAQVRQQAKGHKQTPVLQIVYVQVSYGSELSNRGPTFDMDISDFMDGGQPISYEKAKHYFSQDTSQRWAAYVAGTIIVLMKELNVRFESSISMLVSSVVPEGKGVSSSASVEVATMSAMAHAHGLNISPREIALLCQKVENYVVEAPCGVMDQMTSACGEANKLLAMICQPAEMLGLVDIPSHIRFWGIDSGIRHRGHWVLGVLGMNTLTCYYLDSLRPCQVHQGFRQIVDTAMMLYATQSNLSKRPVLEWINRVCPRQPGSNECGYCVLKYMKDIVYGGIEVLTNEDVWWDKDKYEVADFHDVREDWVAYVTNFIFK